ncbi:MAG: hypothetical protein ACETWK_06175 [Candidatus Aminicenantaceae bacterium]
MGAARGQGLLGNVGDPTRGGTRSSKQQEAADCSGGGEAHGTEEAG